MVIVSLFYEIRKKKLWTIQCLCQFKQFTKSWSKVCNWVFWFYTLMFIPMLIFYILYEIMSLTVRGTSSVDWSKDWCKSQYMLKSFILSAWNPTILVSLNRPLKKIFFLFLQKVHLKYKISRKKRNIFFRSRKKTNKLEHVLMSMEEKIQKTKNN